MIVLPEAVPCPRLTIRRWTPDDVVALRGAIEQSAELLRPWMSFMDAEPMSDDDRVAQIEGWEREAAAHLTTDALSVPRITRVEIHHDAANTARRRVPDSLGFHPDGERPTRSRQTPR